MKVFDAASISSSRSVETEVKKSRVVQVPRHTFYTKFGKRIFDIVLALLLLPLFVPIILVVWVLTRLDGGPGFYSQYRVGLHGKTFRCWKVRTMVMNAEQVLRELCEKDPAVAEEWNRDQKLAKDPRITKIGGFFRATSLDELPQIWNVLRGDMSFIGPRPFMTSQEHLYREAGGEAYFHLRPGITGPWQVDGRGVTTFVDRIKYDSDYLENQSLKTDLGLVWKTVRVVIVDQTGH